MWPLKQLLNSCDGIANFDIGIHADDLNAHLIDTKSQWEKHLKNLNVNK